VGVAVGSEKRNDGEAGESETSKPIQDQHHEYRIENETKPVDPLAEASVE